MGLETLIAALRAAATAACVDKWWLSEGGAG